MRALTTSIETQQRLAIGVPIVALLLSLFVVYPAWGRYNALRAEVATRRKERDALRAAPMPDVGAVPPAETDLPSEPPKFLGQVELIAQMAGCRVQGFDLSPTPKSAGEAARAVRARLDLEGQYSQIRDFLLRLNGAPRLYVVTELNMDPVKITAGARAPGAPPLPPPGTLHAGIGIERYVSPAAP